MSINPHDYPRIHRCAEHQRRIELALLWDAAHMAWRNLIAQVRTPSSRMARPTGHKCGAAQ